MRLPEQQRQPVDVQIGDRRCDGGDNEHSDAAEAPQTLVRLQFSRPVPAREDSRAA